MLTSRILRAGKHTINGEGGKNTAKLHTPRRGKCQEKASLVIKNDALQNANGRDPGQRGNTHDIRAHCNFPLNQRNDDKPETQEKIKGKFLQPVQNESTSESVVGNLNHTGKGNEHYYPNKVTTEENTATHR